MTSNSQAELRAACPAAAASAQRLVSLDALRGFDMFWIIGGEALIHALNQVRGGPVLGWLSRQMEHAAWNGFHFYDLIFPLFLFIAGVTMPFALGPRMERGEPRRALYWRVIRRALLLVALGIIYNGLLKFQWPNTRLPSVLGRIGLAYGLAGIIFLNSKARGQVLWIIGILLGYWAALMLVPVPGHGAGVLTLEGSLTAYVDRLLIPGKLYCGEHDPEGLFGTIPAVATALLGALTGHWLRVEGRSGLRKAGGIAAAGAVLIGASWLWNIWFPINKNLWTSSFVLCAGGWSLLFLGLFYMVIDVWGFKRWAFPLVVIGMNPITIYLLKGRVIDFNQPLKGESDASGLGDRAVKAHGLADGVRICEVLHLTVVGKRQQQVP